MNALSNTITALGNIASNTIKTVGYTALGFTLKNIGPPSPQILDNTVNFFKTFDVIGVLSQIPEAFNTYTEIDPNWAEKLTHHRDAIGFAGGFAAVFSVANEILKVAPMTKDAPKTRVVLATAVTIGAAQFLLDPSVTAEVACRYFAATAAAMSFLLLTRLTCKGISASKDRLAEGINQACLGVIWATKKLQPVSWPTNPTVNSKEINYSVQTVFKGPSSANPPLSKGEFNKTQPTKEELPQITEPTLREVKPSQQDSELQSDLETNPQKNSDSESEDSSLDSLNPLSKGSSDSLDPLDEE